MSLTNTLHSYNNQKNSSKHNNISVIPVFGNIYNGLILNNMNEDISSKEIEYTSNNNTDENYLHKTAELKTMLCHMQDVNADNDKKINELCRSLEKVRSENEDFQNEIYNLKLQLSYSQSQFNQLTQDHQLQNDIRIQQQEKFTKLSHEHESFKNKSLNQIELLQEELEQKQNIIEKACEQKKKLVDNYENESQNKQTRIDELKFQLDEFQNHLKNNNLTRLSESKVMETLTLKVEILEKTIINLETENNNQKDEINILNNSLIDMNQCIQEKNKKINEVNNQLDELQLINQNNKNQNICQMTNFIDCFHDLYTRNNELMTSNQLLYFQSQHQGVENLPIIELFKDILLIFRNQFDISTDEQLFILDDSKSLSIEEILQNHFMLIKNCFKELAVQINELKSTKNDSCNYSNQISLIDNVLLKESIEAIYLCYNNSIIDQSSWNLYLEAKNQLMMLEKEHEAHKKTLELSIENSWKLKLNKQQEKMEFEHELDSRRMLKQFEMEKNKIIQENDQQINEIYLENETNLTVKTNRLEEQIQLLQNELKFRDRENHKISEQNLQLNERLTSIQNQNSSLINDIKVLKEQPNNQMNNKNGYNFEETEFVYLKNIIYKFMIGEDQKCLYRVLATLMNFSTSQIAVLSKKYS